MIPILLRDLAPRLILVTLAALFFYALEPAFHQHQVPADERSSQSSVRQVWQPRSRTSPGSRC
jgi:hypothetical protein